MTSQAELQATWLSFLDERLRAAVHAVAVADRDPDDPLRGLYISDQHALALAGDLGARDAEPRLAVAAERLGLDELDAAVLSVCAAPELHPHYGRLYAYLQDDVTRRLPSPRLVAALLRGEGVDPSDVLGCFAPEARLPRLGALALLVPDQATPLADRPVKLSDRLAAFLLGGGLREAAAPVRIRRVQVPRSTYGRQAALDEIALALRAETRLPTVVCGPDAPSLVARAVASPLVIIDVRELDRPGALADATLASALEGALLCFDGLEGITPAERARLLQVIDGRAERSVLLGRTGRDAQVLSDRPVMLLEVPFPSFSERRTAWERLTGGADVRDVAAKFRLSNEQIGAAAELSRTAAHARGNKVPQPDDLNLGARHASSSRLGELAQRLSPGYGWEDLVLPDRPRDLLSSISAYLRHRDRVLSEWGYERSVSTQGLKVLFAGESGTGKTMAAQVLARELGLDLFRVDLATVVSKYIGETEKNLERIFGAAEGSNAILFFDEADALFGKRSEVSDAHDRYANVEVAYLLQRMEVYPGAVILATNFKRNVDEAFIRRLDFVIDFPFPEAADRRRIWRLVIPKQAPCGEDVDLDFLAAQFKLSGGAIRNCSLAAAFRAADEGGPITMRHLVVAVAQEYGKQGRLTLEADFEQFHELIRLPSTSGPAEGRKSG